MSDNRAQRIIITLGFTNHFIVPSEGRAGEIWDSNVVSFEIVTYSSQAVHVPKW